MSAKYKTYTSVNPYQPLLRAHIVLTLLLIGILWLEAVTMPIGIFFWAGIVCLALMLFEVVQTWMISNIRKSGSIIRLYQDKVTFEFPSGDVHTFTKADISSISRVKGKCMNYIGLRFKNPEKIARAQPAPKEMSHSYAILHFLTFRKHKIPIQYAQFFSKKKEDVAYITEHVFAINRKTLGYDFGILEASYADQPSKVSRYQLSKMEATALYTDLKRTLGKLEKKEATTIAAARHAAIPIKHHRSHWWWIAYAFLFCFFEGLIYTAMSLEAPQSTQFERIFPGVVWTVLAIILVEIGRLIFLGIRWIWERITKKT